MDLFDLFASLKLDKTEYEKGVDDASRSAGGWGNKFKTAAKVAGAGVVAVGTALAGTTKAIVGNTSELAQYGDAIDKNSQKLGVSSKFYQEWEAVLQHSGTSMDSMTATFKKLATASQKATDDQQAAFEALGMSMDEVQSMSTEELFANVINGLQGMEEGTERTALATTLLGKGAMEMGALLNTSAEDTQAMIDTVNNLGGVLSDEAVKNAAAFQDSLQDMKTAMDGAKNSMLSGFLPALTQIMDGFTAFVSGDEGGLDSVNEGVSAFVTNMAENAPKALEAAAKLLEGLATAIVDNLPMLADAGSNIVLELVEYIINALPTLLESGIKILESLVMGLSKALPTLIPAAVEVISSLVQNLANNLPLLVNCAMQLIQGLAQGLLTAIPQLVAAVPQIISSLVTAFYTSVPQIIDAGIQLLVALVEDLPTIIDAIVEAIPLIIEGIVDALSNNIPKIIEAGIKLLTALVKNLPKIITTIVKAIPQIITAIVTAFINALPKMAETGKKVLQTIGEGIVSMTSWLGAKISSIKDSIVKWFKELPSKIKDVGVNLIKGLWEGISNAKQWLLDKISGFTDAVLDGIKSFFGIHSPSKKTEWMGKMLAQGLGLGWDEESTGIIDGINSDLQFGASIDAGNISSTAAKNGLDLEELGEVINAAVASALDSYEIEWNERNLGRMVRTYA